LSLKADIGSNASFSTVTANLLSESGQNNLQGQISSSQASSGSANGSALTLSSSELTATQNTALGSQTLSKGSTNQEIGSYTLSASSAEGVNINTISVALNNNGTNIPGAGYLQNLKVIVNDTQFGTTQSTVGDGTYVFSGPPINIAESGSINVNVFADINSSASGNSNGGLTTLSAITGSGAVSNATVGIPTSVAGQNLTISGTGSTITVTQNAQGTPAAGQIGMGLQGQNLGSFNFQETANIEPVKVTQLDVVDVLSTSTVVTSTANVQPSFSSLTLWNGASQLGNPATYLGTTTVAGQTAFLYQFSFSGSTFTVPRNSSIQVGLKGNVNSLQNGGVTDGSVHMFEIATSTAASLTTSTIITNGATSNLPASITLSGAASTQQTVLQNVLNFAYTQNGASTGRSKSASDELTTLTFTPSSNGTLVLNTTTITFSGSAVGTSTAANATLALVQGSGFGTPIAPATTTTCTPGGTCTATWSFTQSQGQFSTPQTYALILNETGNGTVAASGQNYVSLYATIATSSSIQYTDGVSGTTVSGVGLPTSLIYPLQIFGAQFAQGS
jgi:hypothetical protein